MENIQVFTSSKFGEIRTIERENGIWFVGRDIAAALGYTDYFGAIKKHIDEEEIPKVIQKKADYKSSHEQKLKFTYKEQKEYETIEEDIAKLEEKIEFLEGEMVKNSTDFVKLGDLSKEKEEAEAQLEEKMSRWEYLEDLNEKIQQQNKK